jgi:hypothetical protein
MSGTADWKSRERAEQEDADKRTAQIERKLIREIEEEDARLTVDPPPELSPSERREREIVERVEHLEAEREGRSVEPRLARGTIESTAQHRRREDLRLLRIAKDGKRQAERNREHEKRCARHVKVLEGRIADLEGRARAERERHREALAELGRAHLEASEKLAELNRSLAPDESTEDRLLSLELVA